MPKTARTFSPQEKAAVALAAIKGEKTFAQIGSEYQVHPTQIGLWRKQALDNFASLFADNKKKEKQKEIEQQDQLDNLYKIIGQRDIELDWIKKKLSVFKPY
jgi:transposase